MKFYPIILTPGDGGLTVTSPDFPEIETYGETVLKARIAASDAFREAITARRAKNENIPSASEAGEFFVAVDV